MGQFYLHRGNKLISVGFCPDGDEPLQAIDGLEYGLGEPPEHIRPEIVTVEPTYADKRRLAYPPIGDQLDAIWKAIESLGTDMSDVKDMLARINEVKNTYPKVPNSR